MEHYSPPNVTSVEVQPDAHDSALHSMYEFMVSTLVYTDHCSEDEAMQKVLYIHGNASEQLEQTAASFAAYRQETLTRWTEDTLLAPNEAVALWDERVWEAPIDVCQGFLAWKYSNYSPTEHEYIESAFLVEAAFYEDALIELEELEIALRMADGLDYDDAVDTADWERTAEPEAFERKAHILAVYGSHLKHNMLKATSHNNLHDIDEQSLLDAQTKWEELISNNPQELAKQLDEFWAVRPHLAEHIES